MNILYEIENNVYSIVRRSLKLSIIWTDWWSFSVQFRQKGSDFQSTGFVRYWLKGVEPFKYKIVDWLISPWIFITICFIHLYFVRHTSTKLCYVFLENWHFSYYVQLLIILGIFLLWSLLCLYFTQKFYFYFVKN
jgi:hypothetical protein